MAKTGPKGPWKYTPDFISEKANLLINYISSEELPTEQEFAASQNLDIQRFSEWANPKSEYYNEKFSEALKLFKNKQYFKWLKKAADGKIPPAVFIFFAKNALGMRDEQYLKGEGFNNVMQVIIPESYKPKNQNNRLINSDVAL